MVLSVPFIDVTVSISGLALQDDLLISYDPTFMKTWPISYQLSRWEKVHFVDVVWLFLYAAVYIWGSDGVF